MAYPNGKYIRQRLLSVSPEKVVHSARILRSYPPNLVHVHQVRQESQQNIPIEAIRL
jgi:hypothetical protein